jgi:ubiquinone/menaquinone biosynthesis C-methylase UbiE
MSPFDSLAADYDRTFTESELGRRYRAAVWARLDARVHAGQRLLELNCGTGEDAVHLASLGVHILATDVSDGMVAATRAKAMAAGCTDAVCTMPLAIEDITLEGVGGERFDAVLSNFGGLNCVQDLASTAERLREVVKPGGVVLACVMGPVVPWEMAWYLAHREPRRAIRRLHRSVEWRGLTITYPSPRSLRRAFEPGFRVDRLTGIGVALPPSYVESWAVRHPRTIDRLARWEQRVATIPGSAWVADHYLAELVRR